MAANRPKILISACLVGERVRYDDTILPRINVIEQWRQAGLLVWLCPEVAGGLAVPRPPCERQDDGRILDIAGRDCTIAFNRGAEATLTLAQREGASVAVLKDLSPSCATTRVYDGAFRSRTVPGMGITARLLRAHGIAVFGEAQVDAVQCMLEERFGPPDRWMIPEK